MFPTTGAAPQRGPRKIQAEYNSIVLVCRRMLPNPRGCPSGGSSQVPNRKSVGPIPLRSDDSCPNSEPPVGRRCATVPPPGLDQSVGSIGFHTAKTPSRVGVCFNSASIAEAPRKQVGHVGDSSSTRRTSEVALKSLLNLLKLSAVRDVSGGWPGGVRSGPQQYQPTERAKAIGVSRSAHFVLNIRMGDLPTQQSNWRSLEGKG